MINIGHPRLLRENAKLIGVHFGPRALSALLEQDIVPLGLAAIPASGPRRWADARVGYVLQVRGVASTYTYDDVALLAAGHTPATYALPQEA